MTLTQFDILVGKLTPERREAARLVLLEGLTDADAERKAHGTKTNTVRRDVKRIKADFEFANKVVGNE